MKQTNRDRRKLSRIKRRAVVRFYADGKPAHGIILNFSEIGLFIQSESSLPIGTSIRIPLQGEGQREIEIHGKVVWLRRVDTSLGVRVTQPGMGVELSAAPEEYLRFVAKLRDQLSTSAKRSLDERFDVYHRVKFESGGEFLTEYTENLSRGGMFLATTEIVEPGETIRAQIEIAGLEQPIQIEGKVAYCLDENQAAERGRTAGMGIQFVNLTDEAKAKIHHYISRLEIHRGRPSRRVDHIPSVGTLNEYLVPEILLFYLKEKVTGSLLLERREVRKIVYFKNGQPIYVESTLRNETLAHHLVRRGHLTPLDVEDSLAELAESDLHHGEIMVRGGMIDSTTLANALLDHQEEKLVNTFLWFDGKFEFHEGTDWPHTISIFPLRTYQMIFDGIMRWYDSALISTWMGLDPESALRAVTQIPDDVMVPQIVHRILNGIPTPISIRKIAEKVDLPVEKVIPLAYALIIAGWAVLDFEPTTEASQAKFVEKAPAPASLTEHSVLKRWIDEDFEKIRTLNFFELFSVPTSVDEAQLTKAYMERIARYSSHDISEIADVEISTKIQQIVSWIRLAFDTLKDPDLKQLYMRREELSRGRAKPKDRIEAERMLSACIRDLEKGSYEKAVSGLTLASQMYPNDPAIPGYLGWALFQSNPKLNLKRATELIEKALERDPSDPYFHFYRGEIHAYLNKWTSAHHDFSTAVRLHPTFTKASAALALAAEKKDTQSSAPHA